METATFTNGQLLLEIKVKPNCSQGKKIEVDEKYKRVSEF